MIALGIETSCDETAVAVVKNGREVLSNTVRSSLGEHKKYGGVVPEIASRAHLETILQCLDASLKKARVRLDRADLIAATQGPGLMGSLLVGLSAAKSLALALDKPLVGVDHVVAHIYAGFLSDRSIKFPVLGLAVSGGHTLILEMRSASRVRVLGRTIDDAAGEAFDKVAKMLGLGYPGGPVIDRLSRGQDPDEFFFTRPYLTSDSLDFSFSGIKTAVYHKIEELKRKKRLDSRAKKALCAGFQEAVCEVLVKKTVRAAQETGLKTVIVGGGVSANSRLQRWMRSAAAEKKLKAVFPASEFCQDNAAMIAALGTALFREGRRDGMDLKAYSEFNEHAAYAIVRERQVVRAN